MAGEPISREKLAREEAAAIERLPVPSLSWQRQKWPWHSTVDGCGGGAVPNRLGNRGAPPYGAAFSRLSTPIAASGVSIYGYTAGRCACGIRWPWPEREKLKITEMRIPSKGEIVRTDTAYQGEIVILPSDSVRLNDVLGDQTRLPRKRWREDPLPMLRTTIAPKTAAQRERLLDALTQLADTDPLLRCEVDSITHEIILSFWAGCSWRLFPLCCRKNTSLKQW